MLTNEPAASRTIFPGHDGLFYGGRWHAPSAGVFVETVNPANGVIIGRAAEADAADVDAAVAEAAVGFAAWRRIAPRERGDILREIAAVIRNNAVDLGHLDSLDNGSPIRAMIEDARNAAARFEFFAGLVTELKGNSIPMGEGAVNFTTREPMGLVARIVAFNHPFMFSASKMPAPLAGGNAIIIKPPHQAPLSALRLAELIGDLLPAGTLSILTGGQAAGAALASHPGVRMIGLVGSVETGRAVMRGASETIKPVLFELGGKNALIAFPDADPEKVAAAAVEGMNFTWCGQSCGSTSRIFLHDTIHSAALAAIKRRVAHYIPGRPDDPATTMGSLISRQHYDRVMQYIARGIEDGAELVHGGHHPEGKALSNGYFLEPTVFAGVLPEMAIARDEIFGPVMSVLRWSDERSMIADVNALEFGLTCSIWTNDLNAAHRTAAAVEAGYVWVNEVSKHFMGAPFGGVKQSGIGREECLDEMLSFTQQKNIHIRWTEA